MVEDVVAGGAGEAEEVRGVGRIASLSTRAGVVDAAAGKVACVAPVSVQQPRGSNFPRWMCKADSSRSSRACATREDAAETL